MEPDTFAYDSIMRGYINSDEFELAATAWDTMKSRHLEPFKESLPLVLDMLLELKRETEIQEVKKALSHHRALPALKDGSSQLKVKPEDDSKSDSSVKEDDL